MWSYIPNGIVYIESTKNSLSVVNAWGQLTLSPKPRAATGVHVGAVLNTEKANLPNNTADDSAPLFYAEGCRGYLRDEFEQ